jgi:hypothetical protein
MTITFDSDTMPSGTVEIHSPCPWHEKPGNMGNSETYYDANGVQILTDTGLLGVSEKGEPTTADTNLPRLVLSAVCRDGEIITAIRHAECIHTAIRKGWLPPVRSTEQGFVDNNGVYYSRKDAIEVAIASGQIPESFKKHTLSSEDLW